MSSPDYIVIDIVIAGYQASWPATTGSGNYNLTVVDMATGLSVQCWCLPYLIDRCD